MANADPVIGNVKSSVSWARSAVRRDLRNDRRERLRAMTDENRAPDRLGLQWAKIWLVSVAVSMVFHQFMGVPDGWRRLGIAAVCGSVCCVGFGFCAHSKW